MLFLSRDYISLRVNHDSLILSIVSALLCDHAFVDIALSLIASFEMVRLGYDRDCLLMLWV